MEEEFETWKVVWGSYWVMGLYTPVPTILVVVGRVVPNWAIGDDSGRWAHRLDSVCRTPGEDEPGVLASRSKKLFEKPSGQYFGLIVMSH
jgi:hypothetical protein